MTKAQSKAIPVNTKLQDDSTSQIGAVTKNPGRPPDLNVTKKLGMNDLIKLAKTEFEAKDFVASDVLAKLRLNALCDAQITVLFRVTKTLDKGKVKQVQDLMSAK